MANCQQFRWIAPGWPVTACAAWRRILRTSGEITWSQSLLRAGPQAARLAIHVDGKLRMPELVCDGALLATPAGSTAYNYSAHGPILPIGAEVLALTAVAAFRPRRWRGALLPKAAEVTFDSSSHCSRCIFA